MQRTRVLLAVLAASAMFTATSAEAGIFIDAYGGYSLTQSKDIDTKNGVSLDFKDVDFDDSFAVGARVGYWFNSLPFLGLGLDGAYFRPDVSSQNVNTSSGVPVRLGAMDLQVGSVALLALVQIPIPIIKPYVFAGPAIFITEAKDKGGTFGTPGGEDSDAPFGFKVGAGLRLSLLPFLGIFAEYQFTRFSPEYEFRGPSGTRKVETDVESHHIVGGVSLRF